MILETALYITYDPSNEVLPAIDANGQVGFAAFTHEMAIKTLEYLGV